jgi:hypothetical protein
VCRAPRRPGRPRRRRLSAPMAGPRGARDRCAGSEVRSARTAAPVDCRGRMFQFKPKVKAHQPANTGGSARRHRPSPIHSQIVRGQASGKTTAYASGGSARGHPEPRRPAAPPRPSRASRRPRSGRLLLGEGRSPGMGELTLAFTRFHKGAGARFEGESASDAKSQRDARCSSEVVVHWRSAAAPAFVSRRVDCASAASRRRRLA